MEAAGTSGVTPLEEGAFFVTRQMEAASGTSFPRHRASIESVLVVTDGQRIIRSFDTGHVLKQGKGFIVPTDVWHRMRADREITAVHAMPKEIRFEFSR